MNGRPITTKLSNLLRRPLLWAALCSIVLHLPVLALLSPFWLQRAAEPETGLLRITLASDDEAESGAAQEVAQEAAQEVAQEITQIEAGQAPLAPDLVPETGPGFEPINETIAASEPVPEQQPISASAIQSVASAITTIRFPTAQARAEVAAPAPSPRPVPMTEQDVTQIQTALQTLLQEFNEPGARSDTIPVPSPESLGLPASDSMTMTASPARDLNALQRVDITLRREIAGQAFQMRARLQERALSHYAKFINRWDDDVVLSNDRIDGRFHVNSAVNFETDVDARPQFNGQVTIASQQSVALRLRQSPMFADGLRTGTGRIPLPAETLPAHWLGTGAAVLKLESDTRLEFQGSEGVVWTDMETGATGRMSVPDSGLIIEGVGRTRLELSGTVAGRVLVYSPRLLLITGDLVYVNNPEQSTDTLALISDGSIEIAPASVTGAGDLEIHGALYARQRFSVRRFRERFQGTLYVYGAVVAGSVSATEPRFNTHIEYDSRFNSSRPPAFPTTGLYDLVAWDKQWREVTDSDALLADAADNAAIAAP